MVEDLIAVTRRLSARVGAIPVGDPVAHVYNPLDYAWGPHEQYLRRFGQGTGRAVLVGMNPGPFGMAQSGVPFGDVGLVRDWMGIRGEVGSPPDPHPKRPVLGFDFPRSEVSGTRLWGWARQRFGTAGAFFERFFVVNYNPLLFLHASGRNLTPDKLPRDARLAMEAACDDALTTMLEVLSPRLVIGVGAWAERRARACAGDVPVSRILHPSPASPAANRGWAPQAEAALQAMGEALPEHDPG